LALEQLPFLVERLLLVVRVGGQQELGLEVDQGRGHDHERAGHLEILEAHRLQGRQVLVGDRAQRQPGEIHLVGAAEMEEQVQRADERLDSYGQAGGLRDGSLGGCFLAVHLLNAGAQKWPPHSPIRADFAWAGSRSPIRADFAWAGSRSPIRADFAWAGSRSPMRADFAWAGSRSPIRADFAWAGSRSPIRADFAWAGARRA